MPKKDVHCTVSIKMKNTLFMAFIKYCLSKFLSNSVRPFLPRTWKFKAVKN